MTTNDEMRAAQRAASALWDDYCQAHDVACPDGCDVCCHGHFVPVWAPEVPLLEEAIRRLPEETKRRKLAIAKRHQRLHRKIRAKAGLPLELSQLPASERETAATKLLPLLSEVGDEPCVLLGERGCLIYEDRPFLCRLYGYPTPSRAHNLCEIFDRHNRDRRKLRTLPLVPAETHDRVTAMPMRVAERLGEREYDFTVLPELVLRVCSESED